MQDYIKKAYFSAEFFKDLVFHYNFELADSVKECDELDQYIMARFNELFGEVDAPSIYEIYILNLYRAYCILFALDSHEAHKTLSDELKKDRMSLDNKAVLSRLGSFIWYAHYFRHTVSCGSNSNDVNIKEDCKDTPKAIIEKFGNPMDWWYCGGKMLLNNAQIFEEILFDKEEPKWAEKDEVYKGQVEFLKNKLPKKENEEDAENWYLYCKDRLPYYQELYQLAPKVEDNPKDFSYLDASFLNADDRDELDRIISDLKHYVNTYEERQKQEALLHPPLEEILIGCPVLGRIKSAIQKAIDYGCISYREDGKLGEEGLLVPIVKQGENTFPSDSAFAYFIGYTLHLNERNAKFPQKEVQRVFYGRTDNGTPIDWAAYWRKQNQDRGDAERIKRGSESAIKQVSPKTSAFITRLLDE